MPIKYFLKKWESLRQELESDESNTVVIKEETGVK